MTALLFRFVGLATLLASVLLAQPAGRPLPHLGYAYPAGAQQGTTVSVAVGGQNLNGATAVYFSGTAVQAKVAGYDRPMTQKEINDLREKQQELQDKRAAARADKPAEPGKLKPVFTADEEAMLTDIRTKLANRPNRAANPALAETVMLEVIVPADAPPGPREFRLKTSNGLSNPLFFHIGQLPEVSEPAVIATTNPAPKPNRPAEPRTTPARADIDVKLPTVLNGQILPGEVDRFRFRATRGQRLTIVAQARALLPYLADAVPGWFQATLALHDAHGREIAYDDDFRFDPDPVLLCSIPEDGEYTLEVKDAIYRGREDFVYRIAVGELPFVTGLFPLGARWGGETTFAVAGWNLAASTLTLDTRTQPPGTFQLAVRHAGQLSNAVRLPIDQEVAIRENEPNDATASAQSIELPAIIDGRIARPGDVDVIRFAGEGGAQIVAEVFARRLNSPLDSVLTLTDANGTRLAFNDDSDDPAAGLLTHQADSRLTATLPADGRYYLTVTDAAGKGGEDFAYRLRVGPPRPDFELRVVPSSLNARAGGNVPVTVYAVRRDGFAGEIALKLGDAAPGYLLSGARIPAGQDKIQITLTAPSTPREVPDDLKIIGVAMIGGKPVGHTAVPAEDMMQAFAYHHLVPMRELKVDITGRTGALRLASPLPIVVPARGNATVRIAVPNARSFTAFRVEWVESVPGVNVTAKLATADAVDLTLSFDREKLKGSGNLLLNLFGERATPPARKTGPQRIPLGLIPAIPFEVPLAPTPSA